MSTLSRSPAQQETSRRNGALSHGPVSDVGKATSAANAIRDGFLARWTVGPNEDLAQARRYVVEMVATAGARSFIEGQLAARAGECLFRLERADRVREKALHDSLEARLAASEPSKTLRRAQEVQEGLRGLAALADHISGPVDRAHLGELLPAMRRLAEMLTAIDVDISICGPVISVIKGLSADGVADIPIQVFSDLAAAARLTIGGVEARLPILEGAVEREREGLAEEVALGDDPECRRLDRLRGRVMRELNALLKALGAVQALAEAGKDVPPGSLVPLVLELKVLGRPPR